MQPIFRLAILLVVLAVAGCGAPDAPLTGDDTAPATAVPAYLTPPASVEPKATAELTATAALTPTAVPTTTAALTPTILVPAIVPASPPDPLAAIWIAIGSEQCRVPRSPVQTIAGTELLYVDPAGAVYADPRPLLQIIERSGQPPLLITCPLSDTLAVIDPLTERRIELDLPRSTHIAQTALSADGRLLALIVYPTTEQPPADWAPLRLLDLETGSMRALVEQETIAEMQDGYGADLLGWSGGKLYLHQQDSGTATFWEVDPAQPSPLPRDILILGHSGGWALLPQNQALISKYIGQPPTWLDLQTGQSIPFTASIGLESPDGTTIALIRDTLMFYDVRSQRFHRAAPPFQPGISTYWLGSQSGWWWRADSEELLVVQRRGDDDFLNAVIVGRDGAVRATVPLGNPTGELIGIPKLSNDGDLLLLANANGRVVLRRIDTHATPFGIRDLAIPDAGDIVYAPAP